MRSLFLLLASALFVSIASASPRSAAGATLDGNSASRAGFDSARVRKFYQDGDFEPAIGILESALKENRVPEHRDSVFVFKHLGVMYAASENSRERGKYFMLQLLTIEPTARIMDMYASDMIYMIFKNIQEEFSMNHGPGRQPRTAEPEPLEPARLREPERTSRSGSGSGKAYLWAGAAAVAIGTGVTLYVLNNAEEPAPVVKNHEVK